ncbi:curli production assembly/transport component CsgF [Ulvibacter antarcticus]|uniref:Curli production assembly/transport component CsgF n=1 Tax=Ulvibacter antarcticus TaxID=442714 RepID=A0A3L9YI94_9FLAO|nr:curli production assembly/transport component CsgF [Ulvibacter antarcticus]RMA57875.1 curli production assembly/transport component CsgF [Ulvibacter antarcticus]
MKTIISIVFCMIAYTSFGQQLVYKAINPAFGGDTFNHQWLLAAANAQNSFKDPEAQDDERSELDRFSENLNRQILGQLSRGLFDAQLGDGLQPGTFNFGTLSLEIYESAEGLVINILDTNTGEQTQIIVPNP